MAVEPTFLDSGGLVALLNADDWLHTEAVSSFGTIVRAGGPLITTSFVLAEFANSLARTANRVHVMPFIRQLRSLRATDILFVDPVLFDEAAQKYDGTRDKSWGLVDCVSFVVMERRGISRAFTADQHFTQALPMPLAFESFLTPRLRYDARMSMQRFVAGLALFRYRAISR